MIKINKDILKGNKDTLVEAINQIKEKEPSKYLDLCTYVDTIAEDVCIRAVENGPQITSLNTNGCYIKGTHTIFIVPQSKYSPAVINERAEAIMKYMEFSKKYWSTN